MDAFDAGALVYAAVPGHPAGRRVLALFAAAQSAHSAEAAPAGVGSVLLVPEILTVPIRDEASVEITTLSALLGRLHLLPLDAATAHLAVALGAYYRLGASDAVHLATAVSSGADRFITNNRRAFPQTIAEITITYPDSLPEPLSLEEWVGTHMAAFDRLSGLVTALANAASAWAEAAVARNATARNAEAKDAGSEPSPSAPRSLEGAAAGLLVHLRQAAAIEPAPDSGTAGHLQAALGQWTKAAEAIEDAAARRDAAEVERGARALRAGGDEIFRAAAALRRAAGQPPDPNNPFV